MALIAEELLKSWKEASIEWGRQNRRFGVDSFLQCALSVPSGTNTITLLTEPLAGICGIHKHAIIPHSILFIYVIPTITSSAVEAFSFVGSYMGRWAWVPTVAVAGDYHFPAQHEVFCCCVALHATFR